MREERGVFLGVGGAPRVLVVTHGVHGPDIIRLIAARKLVRTERTAYR